MARDVLCEKQLHALASLRVEPGQDGRIKPIVEDAFQALGKTFTSINGWKIGSTHDEFLTLTQIGETRRAELKELCLDVLRLLSDAGKVEAEVIKCQPAVLNDCPDCVLADDWIVVAAQLPDDDTVLVAWVQEVLDIAAESNDD